MTGPLSLDFPPSAASGPSTRRQDWQHRLSIVSRILAAAFGGYAFATVASVCVSRLFGLLPAEAVMTGLLISFPIYATAIIWCFATRSAARAWGGLVTATLVMGALAWVVGAGTP